MGDPAVVLAQDVLRDFLSHPTGILGRSFNSPSPFLAQGSSHGGPSPAILFQHLPLTTSPALFLYLLLSCLCIWNSSLTPSPGSCSWHQALTELAKCTYPSLLLREPMKARIASLLPYTESMQKALSKPFCLRFMLLTLNDF